MSDYDLVRTRFAAGVWEGIVTARTSGAPAQHRGECAGPDYRGRATPRTGDPDAWSLRIPVPADAIGEGVQTFLIREASATRCWTAFPLPPERSWLTTSWPSFRCCGPNSTCSSARSGATAGKRCSRAATGG